jgi:single-stranded DNA-binding protein
MSLIITGVSRIVSMNRRANGQTQKEFTTFTIANEVWNGTENESHFINCISFAKTGDLIWEHMTVGSRINITSSDLQMRPNKTQSGEEYSGASLMVNRMEFVDGKEERERHFAKHPKEGAPQAPTPQQAPAPQQSSGFQQQAPAPQQSSGFQQQAPAQPQPGGIIDDGDDIPFG